MLFSKPGDLFDHIAKKCVVDICQVMNIIKPSVKTSRTLIALYRQHGKDIIVKKEQRRVIISYAVDGSPVYRMIKANSQDEMNVKIVKAFIQSGRINDLLPAPYHIPTNIDILLKDYAYEWLQRKRRLKETTQIIYKTYLKDYIIPFLGEKRVADITPADVQAMLDKHKKLSKKTLTQAKSVLSQIMKYAVSDEIIKRNPCSNVDIEIPSDRVSVREALPAEEYRDIISHLDKVFLDGRRYLALCLFTAMRKGEVLALRWEDIADDVIHVKRNITYPHQNAPVISTPKTKAGTRNIPLIPALSNYLSPMGKTGYIFGGKVPFRSSDFNAMWKRINKTIDLHGATSHVLRHSYLTYAVGETTDYKTVQGISGHADVFTLVNRYAHPQAEKMKQLSEKMGEFLT